ATYWKPAASPSAAPPRPCGKTRPSAGHTWGLDPPCIQPAGPPGTPLPPCRPGPGRGPARRQDSAVRPGNGRQRELGGGGFLGSCAGGPSANRKSLKTIGI